MTGGGQARPQEPAIYTVLMWTGLVALTLLSFPPILLGLVLCLILDHDRKIVLVINQWWCRLVTMCQPLLRFEVQGGEKLDPEGCYVVVANHQSSLDILLLSWIDLKYRWVAKHTLYLVPFFGWQLWALGHLVVRRGSASSRRAFMKRALGTLEAGTSILVFPEGTRTRTGTMLPFKPGAFILAREARRPILPIVISGTFVAVPPHQKAVRSKVHAVMRVLDPVELKADSPEELQAEMDALRDLMMREQAALDAYTSVRLERWYRGFE